MKNSFLAPLRPACISALRSDGIDRATPQKALALSTAMKIVLKGPMQKFNAKAFVPLILGFFVAAQNAHAFGMGDLLSIGVDVGSKVVGAAVGVHLMLSTIQNNQPTA